MRLRFSIATAVLLTLSALVGGCASSSESASSDKLTKHVGNYPPPPGGIERIRVGVPKFRVEDSSLREANVERLAADQLTSLAFQTQRFRVIERAQLEQLLAEQNLQGIVRDGQLAAQGQVSGIDYLFLGKVTNLRVKKETAKRGLGVAKLFISGVDFEKDSTSIKVECGVDLRLVDPSTGEMIASHFGEYKRTDTVSAFGLEIMGARANADTDVNISEDNKGKILRLALDEAIRKMLPAIDSYLRANARSNANSNNGGSTGGSANFCSGCGNKLAAEAKFCGGCGSKVGG